MAIFISYTLASPLNILTPEVAFMTISLLQLYTLTALPRGINDVGQATVAIRRIKDFIDLEELPENKQTYEDSLKTGSDLLMFYYKNQYS